MKVIIEENTYIGSPRSVVNELRRQLFYRTDVKVGNKYTAMVYIMTRSLDRPPQYPYPSYYAGIEEGYEQNGIPARP